MSSQHHTTHDQASVDTEEVAYISLGSNLSSGYGSPEETLRQAMESLEKLGLGKLQCSSIWHSKPQDCPPNSPFFANAMVGMTLKNSESPDSLLQKLKELERRFGRQTNRQPNAPRTLDLDLITYGSRTIVQADLTIPHPRAFERVFVLFPFEEIAPELVPAGQTRSVAELTAHLRRSVNDVEQKIRKIQPSAR